VPGIYCCPVAGGTFCPAAGRVQVGTSASVTLASGMYVFTQGLTVQGNLTGSDILLYGTCPTTSATTLSCCPSYPGTCSNVPASMQFEGQGLLNVTGRSSLGNILVWMDRTAGSASRPVCNPSQPAPNTAGTISFSGNEGQKLTNAHGVIYAVSSTVTFSGQAGSNGGDISVVSDKICLSGIANLGGQQILLPPPGEVTYSLVE